MKFMELKFSKKYLDKISSFNYNIDIDKLKNTSSQTQIVYLSKMFH